MLHPGFRRRRRLSVLLILALLFSQLATAAYVCPEYTKRAPGGNAAMPECEGASGASTMDPTQPLLCKASCEDAAQSSWTSGVADLAQVTVLLYVLPPAAVSDQDPPFRADALPSLGEPPPGWPPLYLFNRVLRN